MREGLLDTIKSKGYWRINFRPAVLQEPLTLAQCLDIVEKNRVRLRGWDYPHVQRNPEHGGTARVGDYFESWTEWNRHTEFWRMYRSSQFLHYNSLWEDAIQGRERLEARLPEEPALGVISTLYFTTEVFEFLSRLTRSGLYSRGVTVELSLENTAGRILWVDERRRMSFFDKKRNDAERLNFEKALSSQDASSLSADVALDAALAIFDYFGWNPARETIREDQMRFLSGSL